MNNDRHFSIAYVLPEMKLGGSEKHVIALASGMKARGHAVKILTLFRPGLLAPEAEKAGIDFECLGLPYQWGMKVCKGLLDWFGKNPVDIVHACLFGFDAFAAWPARFKKIPAVISSRREIAEWQRPRHRFLVNLSNLVVNKVVCCSKAVRKWALAKESLSPKKTVVIYNGVDSKRFKAAPGPGQALRKSFSIPEDACVAGTIANFGAEKGYPYLMKAAAPALKQNSRLWFLLVGDGPLRSSMEKEAASLPEKDRVLFAGFRSDIPELLNAMDIVVQSSVQEGMPNSVYEGMACGRAVIATRVGGIPEILEHEKDSYLIEPKNEQALAEAVLKLASDGELRNRLGANARKKIEASFSMEGMIDQYEGLYHKSLSSSPKFSVGDQDSRRKTCGNDLGLAQVEGKS